MNGGWEIEDGKEVGKVGRDKKACISVEIVCHPENVAIPFTALHSSS